MDSVFSNAFFQEMGEVEIKIECFYLHQYPLLSQLFHEVQNYLVFLFLEQILGKIFTSEGLRMVNIQIKEVWEGIVAEIFFDFVEKLE